MRGDGGQGKAVQGLAGHCRVSWNPHHSPSSPSAAHYARSRPRRRPPPRGMKRIRPWAVRAEVAAVTLVKSAAAWSSWVAHEGGRRRLPARVESDWCGRRGRAQVTSGGGAALGHLLDHERALYCLGHERIPEEGTKEPMNSPSVALQGAVSCRGAAESRGLLGHHLAPPTFVRVRRECHAHQRAS